MKTTISDSRDGFLCRFLALVLVQIWPLLYSNIKSACSKYLCNPDSMRQGDLSAVCFWRINVTIIHHIHPEATSI